MSNRGTGTVPTKAFIATYLLLIAVFAYIILYMVATLGR